MHVTRHYGCTVFLRTHASWNNWKGDELTKLPAPCLPSQFSLSRDIPRLFTTAFSATGSLRLWYCHGSPACLKKGSAFCWSSVRRERKWEARVRTMWLFLGIDIVPVPTEASLGMNTLASCCQSFDTALKSSRYKSAFLKLVMPMSQLISPLTGAIDVGKE